MSEKSTQRTTTERTAPMAEPEFFVEEGVLETYSGFLMNTASELGDSFVFWFDDFSNEPQDIENFKFVDAISSEPRIFVPAEEQGYTIGLKTDQDDTPFGAGDTFGAPPDLSEIWGDDTDNTLEGNDASNIIVGLAGDDTLSGHGGSDIIKGGADDDTLFGGDGNDYLEGGFGTDTIFGGAGDDHITDTLGDDHLFGGEGADEFFFSSVVFAEGGSSGGYDVIEDFELGVDTLTILNWNESYWSSFGDYIDDHAFGNADPGVTIEWDGGVIRLAGISKSDLNPFDIHIPVPDGVETIAEGFDPELTAAAPLIPETPVSTALTDFGLLA